MPISYELVKTFFCSITTKKVTSITAQLSKSASLAQGLFIMRVTIELYRVKNLIAFRFLSILRSYCHHSGVFNITFEHISHLVLVFVLLTLNRKMLAGTNLKDSMLRLFLIRKDPATS